MPRRKTRIHPKRLPRSCDTCGFVTLPLTDPEWRAKRPIHEMSNRHQAALKRLGKA